MILTLFAFILLYRYTKNYVFFFKEKATKWQENGREIDGLTTNGVLIMHPKGSFCGGEAKFGSWLETSVGGGVFSLRESRSAQQIGRPVSKILTTFFFAYFESKVYFYVKCLFV